MLIGNEVVLDMKNFVKKLLPVSLSRFALLSKDVEDIKTNMLWASEARSIHDELHWDVSVQLLNEVKALRDDLKSHDEKAMLFAWEEYRKEGEALIDAKKRFFTSLPAATGSLRLLQLGSAKLLADFDSLCRDNDIPYFATCGTLLGAARHSGFIPWDDDIDLGMLREDIERLIGLVQSHDRFRVSVAFDGFVQCRQVRFQYADESIPVFLDIFIFDWASTDNVEIYDQQLQIREAMVERMRNDSCLSSWIDKSCVPATDSNMDIVDSLFSNAINEEKTVGLVCDRRDAKAVVWSIDNTVGVDNFHWVSPLDEIFPLIDLEFEGMQIKAPCKYMELLTKHYGDPFSLPNDIASHFKHVDVADSATDSALRQLIY